MPVEFQHFPVTWRLPLFWLEVDPSMAGLPVLRQWALLVGQMFTSGPNKGSAPENVPQLVTSAAQARNLFGTGSMVERMCTAFINNNMEQQLYAVGLSDPSGANATGNITVSHAPTSAGTIDLYIAGQNVKIAVGATDTANAVALNMVSAINNMDSLPVTAEMMVSSGDEVLLTCKWVGLTGNDIDLRDSYLGRLGGQALPTGLTLTYGAMNGGTGTPVLTTLISNLGDQPYEYVSLGYVDTGTLNTFETEYGFGDGGRWGWMRQAYGHVFSAARGSVANLILLGEARNAPETSIMAVEVASPSPVWEWSAAYTAQAARAFTNDPGRPLQTLQLAGILPAPKHQRFILTELNTLASNGLATQQATSADTVQIMRETTTYQFNLYGQPDDAYTDATTLATLARLFRNQKQAITSKFPRHKLADDGTLFGAGQAIVTPKIIKAELVAEYQIDMFNGLVQDLKDFKANLIVERDGSNPNRVNVLYPPGIINQLRIFAVLAQFRLMFNRMPSPA